MSESTGMAKAPLAFDPHFEQRAQDEQETIHALQNVFATMAARVAETEGRAARAVHAKGHALLRGTFPYCPDCPKRWRRDCSQGRVTTTPCCAGPRRRPNNCRTASRRRARWR